ncbi:MAG: hypothetical protein LUD07_09050 [Clostridiales bacterium]|nr:hypothetical protein [Clostridiales bacterium]
MRKFVGIILAAVLATSLAGCSKMHEISHALAVGVNQADQATSESESGAGLAMSEDMREDTREEISEELYRERDAAAEGEDAKNSGKEGRLFGSLLNGAGKVNMEDNREKIDEAIANNMLLLSKFSSARMMTKGSSWMQKEKSGTEGTKCSPDIRSGILMTGIGITEGNINISLQL